MWENPLDPGFGFLDNGMSATAVDAAGRILSQSAYDPVFGVYANGDVFDHVVGPQHRQHASRTVVGGECCGNCDRGLRCDTRTGLPETRPSSFTAARGLAASLRSTISPTTSQGGAASAKHAGKFGKPALDTNGKFTNCDHDCNVPELRVNCRWDIELDSKLSGYLLQLNRMVINVGPCEDGELECEIQEDWTLEHVWSSATGRKAKDGSLEPLDDTLGTRQPWDGCEVTMEAWNFFYPRNAPGYSGFKSWMFRNNHKARDGSVRTVFGRGGIGTWGGSTVRSRLQDRIRNGKKSKDDDFDKRVLEGLINNKAVLKSEGRVLKAVWAYCHKSQPSLYEPEPPSGPLESPPSTPQDMDIDLAYYICIPGMKEFSKC